MQRILGQILKNSLDNFYSHKFNLQGLCLKFNINKICYLLWYNESGLEVDKFHQNLEGVERAPWQRLR